MNTSELAAALARRTPAPEGVAGMIVKSFLNNVRKAIIDGDRIEIRGFGVFQAKSYDGYTGRNPKSGEKVEVPAKRMPKFRMGREFFRLLNGGE